MATTAIDESERLRLGSPIALDQIVATNQDQECGKYQRSDLAVAIRATAYWTTSEVGSQQHRAAPKYANSAEDSITHDFPQFAFFALRRGTTS